MGSSHAPGDYFGLGTTIVEYKATDSDGNSSTCTFSVTVDYDEVQFEMVRIITPDGDGINDQWVLGNIEKFNDNKVTIVDRWGSVIFSARGYNNEDVIWRGTNSGGVTLPTGTYFYTISVRIGPALVEKKGFVELKS
jgi:gliding motility-associated-like protein